MAHIIPDGWRELSVTGAAQRETETLAILAAGLPDDYTCCCSRQFDQFARPQVDALQRRSY